MSSRYFWAGVLLSLAAGLASARAQSAADAPALRGAETSADALPDLDTPAEADTPKPRAAKRPRKRPSDLPPLQPYPRAQRLGLRGGVEAAPVLSPTVAALPTPPPHRVIRRDDNPFAPVGLYVGDLKLTPYFEQSVGYNSNPFGATTNVKGSSVSVTELGVGLQSNWSRNELTGAARIGYNEYFQTPGASAPYGSGVVDYRLDASRDLSFDTEGRYNISTQTNSQLGLNGAASQSLTLVSTYGATGGVATKFGDLTVGLHGSVDRTQYDGGSLTTDNYNDYGLKLRVGYRLSEAVQPFAEVGGDVRLYDTVPDATGYDRNSDGVAGRAGVRLKMSELLTGEASLGYGVREYSDPRLPNAGAPLLDASLIWSATPLTSVTVKAASAINDAVIAGASADINHAYTINLDHALTERVKLGVGAGVTTDNYIGVDQFNRTYTLGATAEYHFSRYAVLKASATHQQFVGSVPGTNYTTDIVLVGLRLQR